MADRSENYFYDNEPITWLGEPAMFVRHRRKSRMKTNYEVALEAIRDVHTDRDVPLTQALENLKGLLDEVTMLIDAIENRMRYSRDGEG